MKGLHFSADFDPRPGVIIPEADRKDKRAHADADKIFRNPKLKLIDLPKPKIEKPDQVLIKVKACGICGTDTHLLETDEDGYVLYPGHMKGDQVIGHEFAGIVEEIGPAVTTIKVGDYVTVEEMNWCGVCDNCRNGFPNQCTQLEEFGITINGGYEEYVVGRAAYCWNINGFKNVYKDEDKLWEAGALCEPSCVAYNAVFECGGGFRPGAYVVIFGCGPIGLFSIAHCKNAGAGKVIVFEPIKERVALAKAMGADYILDPTDLGGKEIYEVIMDLTEGRGADFFVEASGVGEKLFPHIEKSLAAGAKVIYTAMGKERMSIYMVPFAFKKGRIFISVGHSGYGNFMYVIRMISNGLYDPTQAVTARYPLSDIIKAIEDAKTRAGGKIIIKID